MQGSLLPCTSQLFKFYFLGIAFTPTTYEIFRLEASPAECKLKPLQRQLCEKQLWRRLNWSCSGRQTILMAFWGMDEHGGEKENKASEEEEEEENDAIGKGKHRRSHWHRAKRRCIQCGRRIWKRRWRGGEKENVSNVQYTPVFLLQLSPNGGSRKNMTKIHLVLIYEVLKPCFLKWIYSVQTVLEPPLHSCSRVSPYKQLPCLLKAFKLFGPLETFLILPSLFRFFQIKN